MNKEVQKKKDEFELKVIFVNKEKWKKDKQSIEKVMKKILENKIKFIFKEVNEIKSLKTGKYEYIRSEMR